LQLKKAELLKKMTNEFSPRQWTGNVIMLFDILRITEYTGFAKAEWIDVLRCELIQISIQLIT